MPNRETPDPELTALRQEVAALRARIAALEAERDEYVQQNAELFVLQQVFSTINSLLEIDDILATVLRGIYETMGFGRVVLFDVHDGTMVRRLETGPEGNVTPSGDLAAVRMTGALRAVLEGRLELAIGLDDSEAPLKDSRGPYAVLPLVGREAVRGILYVDDVPSGEIGESQLRMLLDFASQAAVAMENARLLAETRRLLEETERLASRDPLTGVANRRTLGELLERELYNAARYRTRASLFLFDLDDFKAINDVGGHLAGDEALKTFAGILESCSRRGDVVARYGGDEFVLFMTQCDRESAAAAVQRFYEALGRRGLRSSVGIALFPDDGTCSEELFKAADQALYAAKAEGKNRFRFASGPG